MSRALVPCTACSRHVAAGEPACPFCGAAPSPAAAPVARSLRASRAALLAAGAGTLLATAACAQTTTPIDRDAEPVDAISPDGPSAERDAAADGEAGAGPVDATDDGVVVRPAYGGFVVDATSDDATP